jgi:hypothetical protein
VCVCMFALKFNCTLPARVICVVVLVVADDDDDDDVMHEIKNGSENLIGKK